MPTLEGLQAANNLTNGIANQTMQTAAFQQRQQAAQKASQLYQAGDLKGAYATLMADPGFAEKFGPQISAMVPEFGQQIKQGQETGQLQAETPFGSNPNQLENLRGQYQVEAAKARNSSGRPKVVKDPNSPTGFSVTSPDGTVMPVENYTTPSGQAEAPASGSQQSAGPKPLAPQAQGELNKTIRELDKDPQMKDLNTEINGLQQVKDLASGNFPGSKQPLIMKFLTSSEFVKRFNEGEYNQSPIQAQSTFDQVKNWVANKGQGKIDKEVLNNFMDIVDNMQHSALNEYQGQLESKAGALESATNKKLDKDTAMQKLLPGTNPIFKTKAQKYVQLSDDDKQAVDWARQNLGDPRALQILRMHGL